MVLPYSTLSLERSGPFVQALAAAPSVSSFAGIFIISNAALGVGTLNFPEAFASSGGLAVSIPLLLCSAIMCALSLSTCALANRESQKAEFFQAVRFYGGPAFEGLYHLTLILANMGTCIMYMVTVGDQSDEVMVRMFGESDYCAHWYLQRTFTIPICSLFIILPLCLAKTLDFLKYPSMLAVLSFVYMMAVIVADYAVHGATDNVVIDTKPSSIVDLFNALPTIVLGYQCMTNGYPVFGSFSSPTLGRYLVSILGSVIIMTSIYLPVGMFGYLKNGQDVSGNILLDYDSNDNKVLVAQIAVLIAVMMSYPTLFSITRVSMNKVWVKCRRLDEDTDNGDGQQTGQQNWVRRYVIAAVHFVITLAIAIFLPNISVAAAFTGSLSTFFYFIFPGLFMIQSTYVNENHQFVYPTDSKSKYSHLDRNSFGTAFEEQADSSTSSQEERITEIERQTANKKAFIDDEHMATQSVPYSTSSSFFMRNKYRNGALSWIMRFMGMFFSAFGLFVFGLGVANAVMSVDSSEPSNIECPN